MSSSAQLAIFRSQVRRACEAWWASSHARPRGNASAQLAACDRATTVWELIALVGQNAAADRVAQEDLGRLAPAADAPRLRMLVLHRDLLDDDRLFGSLGPAQKQVINALRTLTGAQIAELRKHAPRVRQSLGAEAGRNADLSALLS